MRRYFAPVVLVALVLALAGTAQATPPAPVTMSVTTTIVPPGDPFPSDAFASTGGIVCASGTMSATFDLGVGWQSGDHFQILVGKHVTCSDGTFELLLRVTLDFATGNTWGTWSVQSGTGAYQKLHGAGQVVGTRPFPGSSTIDDEYTGSMHVD